MAFSLLLSALFALQAQAQSITVKGTVTDDFGAVIGASVVVKGTTNGCITDMDGNYTINDVASKATLVFSYVGYKTQEVPVNGQKVINVMMKEDAQQLSEVVVVAVGYGDVKRRDLTGAIGNSVLTPGFDWSAYPRSFNASLSINITF